MLTAKITGGGNIRPTVKRIANNFRGIYVQGGILEGATYSGQMDSEAGQWIAPIAAAMEYGTKRGVPSRPFMRNTIDRCKKKWVAAFKFHIKGQTQDQSSINRAFVLVGHDIATDLMDTIERGVPPVLNEQTIKRKRKKGRESPEKTLIDTGEMMRAISSEVITE